MDILFRDMFYINYIVLNKYQYPLYNVSDNGFLLVFLTKQINQRQSKIEKIIVDRQTAHYFNINTVVLNHNS